MPQVVNIRPAGPAPEPARDPVAGRFAGRALELGLAGEALTAAIAGAGEVVLLTGEAGIGKTRLAERIAAEAAGAGVRVAWGTCWAGGGAPPYWPWIQLLRGLAHERGGGARPAEVAAVLDRLQAPPSTEAEGFALADAVAGALRAVADRAPLACVIEDLHVADEGSLQVLRFVARQLHDVRVLVVGTHRDVAPGDARFAPLDAIAAAGRRLALRGLAVDELRVLAAGQSGEVPADDALAAVHAVSGGHPLFAEELLRQLSAAGEAGAAGALPLPDRVRAVLLARLEPLEAATRRALTLAAVLGERFRLGELGELGGWDRREALEVLGPALGAGLVAERPGATDGFGFAHALVRDALYEELGACELRMLHADAARALGGLAERAGPDRIGAVARHLRRAVPVGDAGEAIEASADAAARALRAGAHDDAAGHAGEALALAEDHDAGLRRRGELLLMLGEAHYGAGRAGDAKAAYERAAELARESGSAQWLARAALGYGGGPGGAGYTASCDQRLVALLEEALDAVGPQLSSLRVRLLARLAVELYYTPEHERRDALSRQAVEEANAAGDMHARLVALQSRHWSLLGPDTFERRRRGAEELLRLAEATDDAEMRFRARQFRLTALLELGDLPGVDAEIELCRQLAATTGRADFAWQVELMLAMRALMQGRNDEGEQRAVRAFELGQAVDAETAANLHAAQVFHHRWQTGRLDELRDAIRLYAAQRPWIPAWRCAVAFLEAELGNEARAAAELDAALGADPAGLPRDGNWFVALLLASLTAAALGDGDRAAALYALLEPYPDRCVILAAGDVSLGPIAVALGALAATLERWEEGERHFTAALTTAERLGAGPIAARALLEHGVMLQRRGAPGDDARAAGLLDRAIEIGEGLNMVALVARARGLRAGCAPAVPVAPAAPAAPAARGTFRRTGDHWELGLGERTVVLSDLKGLGCIETLLARPHVAVPAAELIGGAAVAAPEARAFSPDEASLRRAGQEDGGELLDAHARAAYRARLAELEGEIAEAEALHDPERIARLRAELGFVAEELERSLGLGGRARRFSAPAERARVNATRAIKAAVRRVSEHDPALGRHLATCVRTGGRCVYAPPPGEAVRWQLTKTA